MNLLRKHENLASKLFVNYNASVHWIYSLEKQWYCCNEKKVSLFNLILRLKLKSKTWNISFKNIASFKKE